MSDPANIVFDLIRLLQADSDSLVARTEKVIEAHGPTVQRATVAVGAGLGLVIVASILVLGGIGFLLTSVYLSLQEAVSSMEAAIWTGLITLAMAGGTVVLALLIPAGMQKARQRRQSKPVADAPQKAEPNVDVTTAFQKQVGALTNENTWTAVTMSFVSGFATGLGDTDSSGVAREFGGSLAAVLACGVSANAVDQGEPSDNHTPSRNN